ncbi:MAG TPA: hypothetical protein OGM06_13515 [Clostridiales bacterium]|nr:hypothetical protein [Clostridiales bacterium]
MESAEAIFAGYRKSLSMIQLWKEKSERMGALQDALRDEEIEAMMLARPPMKESSRSSALHSPMEWAVCKLEKMDAADEQMRSHLRIVQLHEAIMRTLTDPEKWFVTKYYDEHYALATLPNLPDSPYRRAARSTMSNVKKRILSKADSFLTEMATCLRI